MLNIPGYDIQEQFYKSDKIVIYRGIQTTEFKPVILKMPANLPLANDTIVQYQKEYEILKQVSGDGIIKALDLLEPDENIVLIYEDIGGDSLLNILASKKLNISDFLHLAEKITAALHKIHHHNIIHKNINPANIIWNPKNDELRIIDFSIATMLQHETPEALPPRMLDAVLEYISPEQTGRMNRAMDYRTDFYSLGMTCYEMLMGFFPFQATDELELIHYHLAREPIPPHVLNKKIPVTISKIILKLLEKNPEDRYQSSSGLLIDWQKCNERWKKNGRIDDFPLGEGDISARFQIPQKVYGRETETEMLMSAFHRVCDGNTELMVVSGYSGIGKTVLVNQIQKPIVEQKARFSSGGYDQFQRNIPYIAIIQAFRKLVQQLLTESKAILEKWKRRFIENLGANAQVIIDVIPELSLIIGKQPHPPGLSSAEAQNRFKLVFQDFVNTFAHKEHPLVIFLDNLQWADTSSLKLIEQLTEKSGIRYLLLICAYRSNEVTEAHPLAITLEEIEKTGADVNYIMLKALPFKHINRLIADTMQRKPAETTKLSEICAKKTGGNPFFLRQFLFSLYKEKIIQFEQNISKEKKSGWIWNSSEIEKMDITDNVVDLMINNIKKLSERTQHVIQLATCIGSRFDLNTLTAVNEKSLHETENELREALDEELILATGSAYQYARKDDKIVKSEVGSYKFLHDKVQQAAYSLIDKQTKKQIHLKIGRLLLSWSLQTNIDEKLFDIVNQLNQSIDLITERKEQLHLARLNLQVGEKSKASAAYDTACEYFETGLKLLDEKSWQSNYNLWYKLTEQMAETAFLKGDFETMTKLADELIKHASTTLEKVNTYQVIIQAFIAQNQLVKATNAGLEVLRLLGVYFPRRFTMLNIIRNQIRIRLRLSGKQIDNLAHLPAMQDNEKLAAMRIMSRLVWAVYSSAPDLFALMVYKMIWLSLTYGNSSYSAFGYACYGLLLCGKRNDIPRGYQFGKLALNVLDAFDSKSMRPQVLMIFNRFILHWKEHPKNGLKSLIDAYKSAMETGELGYAAHFAQFYCSRLYLTGQNLKEIERKMNSYFQAIQRTNQEKFRYWQSLFWQVVLNLKGKSKNPYIISGEVYDEDKMLPRLFDAYDRTGLFDLFLQKTMLCYLFHEFSLAQEMAETAEQYLDGVTALISASIYRFYDSLVAAAVYPKRTKTERRFLLQRIAQNQKKLKKWAKHAPMNYLHKWYLVEAELARIQEKDLEAMDYYDKAIQLVRNNEYIQEEALANELAARFFLERHKHKVARNYIREAYYSYEKWGAAAKLNDLEQRYPQLFMIQSKTRTDTGFHVAGFHQTTTETLDYNTLMKATQILTSEMVLEKLLRKMMLIVMENAGAAKGFLILEKNDKLYIEAESITGNFKIHDSYLLENIKESPEDQNVSNDIVNYVKRTKNTVVLHNACQKGKFVNAPYIQKHQVKSVLCLPLVYQNRLTGMLYMENNLLTGAFTENRIELLQLLSTQMAISIENAKNYGKLEQQIQYLKSGLKEEDSQKYMHKLLQYMRKEKPYLQNKLSLKEVADKIGISSNHLSQVINENFQQNFMDFINSYRVEEVKKRLKDPENKQFTILSIAFDCGFNSKSSFNNVFKKYTGKTPTQYMKSQQ